MNLSNRCSHVRPDNTPDQKSAKSLPRFQPREAHTIPSLSPVLVSVPTPPSANQIQAFEDVDAGSIYAGKKYAWTQPPSTSTRNPNFVKTRYRKPHILCALAAMFELPRLKKQQVHVKVQHHVSRQNWLKIFGVHPNCSPCFFFNVSFLLALFGFSHRTK